MTCQHCSATLDPGALVCIECGREQRDATAAPAGVPLEPEPAKAVDQPCPKHPALPIAGACPRCGVFVCIRCAPGAANDVLTCTDCLSREQRQYALEPSPFGGPLVFPLLGLVFNVLAFGGGVTLRLMKTGWANLSPLTRGLVASMAALVLAMIVTFIGYLQRRRWVPWAMVVLYVFDIGIAAFGEGAARGWMVWCLAWLVYFLAAGRVKQTFTE